MGKESDHIHVVALTRSLKVPLSIEYMDREGSKCNMLTFDPDDREEAKASLFLLYRPGHYDILYPSLP